MPRRRLTAPAIASLKPPAVGRVEHWDAVVPALALRVSTTGAKSYVVRGRVKGWSRPLRVTLGTPDTITLAEAREQASEVLRQMRGGIDPRVARRQAQQAESVANASTFRAVAEDYIAKILSKKRSRLHSQAEIERYLIPRWGSQPIASISPDDVGAVVNEIAERSPSMARLVLVHAKAIFRFASKPGRPGRLHDDPTQGLSAKKTFGIEMAPRQVTLSPELLRRVWHASERLGDPWRSFIRVLALSGQRRGEVSAMSYRELDLDGDAVWIIPAMRMKAGRAHEVPLSPPLLAILRRLREKRGHRGDFLFSTTGGEKPVSGFSKMKRALAAEMAKLSAEPLPEWSLHDVRRTVRTGLGALPVPHDIRELVVAHVPPALVRTYDLHSYREEKRHALELWARKLLDIVGGAP